MRLNLLFGRYLQANNLMGRQIKKSTNKATNGLKNVAINIVIRDYHA